MFLFFGRGTGCLPFVIVFALLFSGAIRGGAFVALFLLAMVVSAVITIRGFARGMRTLSRQTGGTIFGFPMPTQQRQGTYAPQTGALRAQPPLPVPITDLVGDAVSAGERVTHHTTWTAQDGNQWLVALTDQRVHLLHLLGGGILPVPVPIVDQHAIWPFTTLRDVQVSRVQRHLAAGGGAQEVVQLVVTHIDERVTLVSPYVEAEPLAAALQQRVGSPAATRSTPETVTPPDVSTPTSAAPTGPAAEPLPPLELPPPSGA